MQCELKMLILQIIPCRCTVVKFSQILQAGTKINQCRQGKKSKNGKRLVFEIHIINKIQIKKVKENKRIVAIYMLNRKAFLHNAVPGEMVLLCDIKVMIVTYISTYIVKCLSCIWTLYLSLRNSTFTTNTDQVISKSL